MKLSYSILWIEDSQDFIESFDIESLADGIEQQGFDVNFVIRSTPEEIQQPVDGTQFDLIVVDYNVAEGDFHGSDVIKQVRNHNCLTEVIFYSQNSVQDLRDLAAKNQLEGVFFSTRTQLSRKIFDVFMLTVRKVIDVDNMRGIVMAGVAELDHLVTDVIQSIHEKLEEDRKIDLRKRLLEKMRPVVKHLRDLVHDQEHASFDEVEALISAIVNLDPADFEILIKARGFDSSRRVDMVTSLCKDHDNLKPHKEEIINIKKLLQWRNALAHQRPKYNVNGFPIFEPKEGTEETFDDARTLSLRQEIRAHRNLLNQVLSSIRST